MRRLIALIPLMATLIVAPVGCRIRHKAAAQSDLLSVIEIDDPRGAAQLTHGFYGLEANSWRWTMKQFAVTLRPPANAATNGGRLELKFVLPEQILKAVGPITVAATVNGLALGPETYSKDGECTYARDVPAFAGKTAVVEFVVDKGIPPKPPDTRELAVIVTRIALDTK